MSEVGGIKDILVCLNNVGEEDTLIQVAAQYARENNARLTGIFIMADAINNYYVYEHLSADLLQQLIDEGNEHAARAEQRFNNVTKKVGCDTAWHTIAEGKEPIQVMYYTDLVFMRYSDSTKNTRFMNTGFINHLLLETGRPVIVIPDGWNNNFGNKILLGWNESRESARAMHEALPLMQSSEKVDIVTVDKELDKKDLAKGMEVSTYLARRGVSCQLYAKQRGEDKQDIGSVLLDHASEHNSDLIVVGGYGHSHLREVILGGVTQYLVHHSHTPILLVH